MASLLVALDIAVGLAVGGLAFVIFVARPVFRRLREVS